MKLKNLIKTTDAYEYSIKKADNAVKKSKSIIKTLRMKKTSLKSLQEIITKIEANVCRIKEKVRSI